MSNIPPQDPSSSTILTAVGHIALMAHRHAIPVNLPAIDLSTIVASNVITRKNLRNTSKIELFNNENLKR